MNSSFLSQAWGVRGLKCTREQYKGNTIILHVQNKKRKKVCPKCGRCSLVKNGKRIGDFLALPIGGRKVILRMQITRYKCRCTDCDYARQEEITFAQRSRRYTRRFARYAVELLRHMNIKDVATLLGVSWDMIKEIHTRYLKCHYASPCFEGLRSIGIDEFAVRKGHVYKTTVVNLETGRILYVGEGKGVQALEAFWRKMKRKGITIRYVATDLSAAFIASVLENAPGAVHVFDHFHVVKLMNDKLDKLRRQLYGMEKDINKRKVIKGTRYLLLRNGTDIYDEKYRTRLENALAMNEPLSKAYYLKEQLREIWSQPSKEEAERVFNDWIEQARESKIPLLAKMAQTMRLYQSGILAWYDARISTAKVEGINHKIKVMKRNAYGFRDQEYFMLRLYALHDSLITRNVG